MAKRKRPRLQESPERVQKAPSSPKRPPKYVLSFEIEGGKYESHSFSYTGRAKAFLDAVINNSPVKWLKRDRIAVRNLEIQEESLEEIIEYEGGDIELLVPDDFFAARLCGEGICAKCQGRVKKGKCKKCGGDGSITGDANAKLADSNHIDRSSPDANRNSRKSRDSQRADERPSSGRPTPVGMISLASICTELKIDAREARQYLRKHVDKPDHGAWAWTKKEAEEIKQDLRKELK